MATRRNAILEMVKSPVDSETGVVCSSAAGFMTEAYSDFGLERLDKNVMNVEKNQ